MTWYGRSIEQGFKYIPAYALLTLTELSSDVKYLTLYLQSANQPLASSMGIKVYLVNVILIIAICVSFVQQKSTPEENAKQSKVISVKVVNSYGQNLNGVSLSLKKGNTEIRSGKTGYDGMLIFPNCL